MNLKPALRTAALAVGLALHVSPSSAASFEVFAAANSSSGGSGLPTILLAAGQNFTIEVDPTDLWSAGALPRWSNANGLTGDLFATGSDESGEAAGTKIGQNFGTYSANGLIAPYGALVGRIGAGPYFIIGTSYAGIAAISGILNLYYWDENFEDNADSISAIAVNIDAVPIPGALPLFVGGLGMVAFVARRRKQRAQAPA